MLLESVILYNLYLYLYCITYTVLTAVSVLLESGPVSRSVGKPQRLISRFAGPTFHCDDVTDFDHHDRDHDDHR